MGCFCVIFLWNLDKMSPTIQAASRICDVLCSPFVLPHRSRGEVGNNAELRGEKIA